MTQANSAQELTRWVHDAADHLHTEVAKVIVGQDEVIEQLLIAIFCRGHCLLVGVPGLAKTLLISTLARDARPVASTASSSRPT